MDLVSQVGEMLLHIACYKFMPLKESISKFIHTEANGLGPEYQMVRITVKLDDITKFNFDEGLLLTTYTGLETVKCNNSCVDEEACPICLERLDSEKDETMIITRAPCGHMFHRNCIISWFKRKRTCPMCRFKMKTTFRIKKDEQMWVFETTFKT
ncbi:RING-H2 finger protein ATL5 [Acorus gramineus]|uniref:RING-type E3 ubiquitin transferase n=1 Tax=Acorus gramineus TaxID=55184 RepID=A0AAV9A7Z9_ACOGR|nr:RING-H2 finger protein ATL5 [Acorus gramineus]